MNTRSPRLVSLVRTGFAFLTFAALAAVGFATTQALRPALNHPATNVRTAIAPGVAPHAELVLAPAAAPMSAAAFRR